MEDAMCRSNAHMYMYFPEWQMFLSPCVQVRAICGSTYMLTQDEELWEKELPPGVDELISADKDPLADRSDRCECVCVMRESVSERCIYSSSQ